MTDTQHLKEHCDLRRLVEQDLGPAPLRGGRAYLWKCPCHHEHKGFSLAVWANGYRCFGACDTSGDALDWLTNYRRLSFVEALRVLGERMEDVVGALARHLDGGHQAYWVCPMVRESESEDIAAAEARHAALSARFGETAVLVHGQLRPEAKDAAMERFARGDAKLLVATTVIEVGVDVPAATLMVIEQAERFGLAQLHQLRGRVGRGEGKSTCLLLRGASLSETARDRLALMRETQDGFRLAEEDLRLRGGGELLGTRQSGDTPFRVASLEQITRLLPLAHDDARLLIDRDGGLTGPRGEAARLLLYLFERDWGVQLLRGG